MKKTFALFFAAALLSSNLALASDAIVNADATKEKESDVSSSTTTSAAQNPNATNAASTEKCHGKDGKDCKGKGGTEDAKTSVDMMKSTTEKK